MDQDEKVQWTLATLMVLERNEGIARCDVVGVAHAALVIWAVQTVTTPSADALRATLATLRSHPPRSQGPESATVRHIKAVTSDIILTIGALWRRVHETDEDATFSELWGLLDRAALERRLGFLGPP